MQNARVRVTVVGDTVVSEQGLAALVGRNHNFEVCAAAHTFEEANRVIEQSRPDLLLIEPFMPNCDGIRWIKEIATQCPATEILVVSRQAEETYAERVLRAGASGYWMKNGSADELMRAIAKVVSGEIYVSPMIAALAVHKLAKRRDRGRSDVDLLSDRELAVFSLIAAGRGVSQMAAELGISRKTVESHCEHIKQKLKYPDAEALRQGARRLLGGQTLPRQIL